jgi:hypothetical protein
MSLMPSARTPSGSRNLLKLGKDVVSSLQDRTAECPDILERYVGLFSEWESSWKGDGSRERAVSSKDIELGKRIAAQHALIVRLTAEMMREMEDSLKSLRVKGRGLKAYIDHLPQRVSTIKARKG